MAYQLIAFDMDGTLLDDEKRVRPSSAHAIERAVAAGRTVAICSGRCPKMIELNQESFSSVRYAICCNGTVLYDLHEHRVISALPMSREVIVAALDALGADDALIDAFQGPGFYCEGSQIEEMARYEMQIYQGMYRTTAWQVDDIRSVLLDEDAVFQKLIFHFVTPDARERFIARLGGVRAELARSETASLEFSPAGVTKGTGLLALADLLGIEAAATIAVGDADNDIDMLRVAGLGVAMGNAIPEALAAADEVAPTNAEDGFADFVERRLLG